MTYVSKKEKVFDLPDQDELSSISLNVKETKLKSFLSVSDRRAWTSEEFQRYQHLYGLVKDSEVSVSQKKSNISRSSSFKYIPFDVLLAILMAEKDAYIQELLERQEENRSSGGKAKVLYKSEGFEDSDDDREALIRKDAEVVALKNKIVGLGTQLEDYKDTLTKAMHKLENMDAVMSENNLLREKIKCSQETIKCLEGKKEELEKELKYYKTHFGIPDGHEVRQRGIGARPHMDGGDCDGIARHSSEKDILVRQIEKLQKELEKAKAEAAEVEVLRKVSETTSSSLEEIAEENKCYKAKLESMKCLEAYVEELKRQAHSLTDRYKRESQKANEHLKQIEVNKKELQALREERDKLNARVNELTVCESQYLSLKGKLQKVELIIDENEMLNKKLVQLDRLELENEQLKLRIEQMKTTEFQAIEDKKLILQLQCEVAQQEEEIKRMLKHIENLTNSYPDDEIYQLQLELEDKNGKLKKYERQLDDIPVLESEIEELKHKLQKCIDDFGSDKDLLRRLQEELEACRSRCHELEEMVPLCKTAGKSDGTLDTITEELEEQAEAREPDCSDKGENTVEIVTEESGVQFEAPDREEKATFTVDETAITLRHVEEQNKILKSEVASLTLRLSKIDLDELIAQTNELKCVLRSKDEKIQELDLEVNALRNELESYKTLKQCLEKEVELYKERAEFMTTDLNLKQDHINAIQEAVTIERKERVFATDLIKTLEEKLEVEKLKRETGEAILKLQKEESNLAKQEIYAYYALTVDHQKGMFRMSRKLNEELKRENEILREAKEYVEQCEGKALRNLVSRLRAEVRALRSLSKPELESECECLQRQVGELLKETDNLLEEIKELKSALDSEKNAKDVLEKEVTNLQAELCACVAAGKEIFGRELSAKEALIRDLREELQGARKELEKFAQESEELKERNAALTKNVSGLEAERKDLKNEINLLQTRQNELNEIITGLEEREKEYLDRAKHFEEICAELQHHKEELSASKESVDTLRESCRQLEEKEKENWEKLKRYEEVCAQLEIQKEELSSSKESIDGLEEKVRDLEEKLKTREENIKERDESFKVLEESTKMKERELDKARSTSMCALNELNRLTSEITVLKRRLAENERPVPPEGQASDVNGEEGNFERDLQEKFAVEEALRKMETELDDLKKKLEECRGMEEEMASLRHKRDTLLDKMSDFECEINRLKGKLSNFESLKNELDQLKSRKGSEGSDRASKLEVELLESKTEIENLKAENDGLREELSKKEALLEIRKNLPKIIPETPAPPGVEFFTPPMVLSPHASAPESSPEYISLESHKKEIADVESRYESLVNDLRETNAERIKKLTEHYERESKSRIKSFNDSMNTVRSSYESDIKKLVEKHKASIMRLQGLHEDEVQELNTTYETQMEAMQTQNENLVNDMRTEAAEKYKELREQHNRDLRELARKYEEMLREKEARLQEEKQNSEDTVEAGKELNRKESLTKFYQNSIAEMEEKHSQELKKCKKNNLKRIELMKNKYEALLVEERKKFEEQLEEMLLQLKNGQPESNPVERVPGEHPARREQQERSAANSGLEFTEVLHKILNEGLECLSFEELILVHSKTCFIPEHSAEGDSGVGEFTPRPKRGCKHRELMAAEKEELLKRIFTLEHEMVIKQLETHEAIVNMEAAEFCRIRELKSALCTAQQKNAELKRLLSAQSKNEMGLKIDRYMSDKQASFHETNVVEKVKELEREKAEKKRLEEELQKERANLRNLTTMLEAEKERHLIQRKRDAEYVESIRQRLEEALNHEQKMEAQLDYELKLRARLEDELQNLQRSLNFGSGLSHPPLQMDIKAVKDIKNQDQSEVARKSRHSRSKSKRNSKLKSINN